MNSGRILVVGGYGNIGRALSESLVQSGLEVIKTSRRPESGDIHLDLSDLPVRLNLPKVDVAVICAGIGSVGLCESDPEFTRKVNVDAPKRIIEEIVRRGGKAVFLSSTQVFDGKKSFYHTAEARNPITNYGRQKAEVESYVEENYKSACAIVRLTKVFPKEGGLLRDWASAWEEGRVINAFEDIRLSPVSLDFAVAALTKIVKKGLTGKFHISADMETTYYCFAKSLASKLGYSEDLAVPVSGISLFSYPMPVYASLLPSFNEVEINGKIITNNWSDFMEEIVMNLTKSSGRKPLLT